MCCKWTQQSVINLEMHTYESMDFKKGISMYHLGLLTGDAQLEHVYLVSLAISK